MFLPSHLYVFQVWQRKSKNSSNSSQLSQFCFPTWKSFSAKSNNFSSKKFKSNSVRFSASSTWVDYRCKFFLLMTRIKKKKKERRCALTFSRYMHGWEDISSTSRIFDWFHKISILLPCSNISTPENKRSGSFLVRKYQ